MAFEWNLEQNLCELLVELEHATYRHGSYQTFELKDSKRRRIDKASVRDRVVHELLFRYLESVYEPRFISDSFSSRKGKGTLAALARADAFLAPWRAGAVGWVAVVGDVESFFATVPHPLLLKLLAWQVRDERIFALVKEIVQSFQTYGRPGHGIPLGNVTSQIFANIVLHELDIEAKQGLHLRRYVRYNDDILAVMASTDSARLVENALRAQTSGMGLKLKTRIVQLGSLARFDWLGATHSQGGRMTRSSTYRRIERARRLGVCRLSRRGITENQYRRMFLSYQAHLRAYGQDI